MRNRNYHPKKWYPCTSGGTFRKWYGNLESVVNFLHDGEEIINFSGSHIKNRSFYFKESITWTAISSGMLSMRYVPEGFLPEHAGNCLYCSSKELSLLQGFTNSIVGLYFLGILSPTLNFNVGNIASLPIIAPDKKDFSTIIKVTDKLRCESKSDWDSFEASWDFQRHHLVRGLPTVEESFAAWQAECDGRFARLKANEEELNRIFIDIYGLQDELTPEVEDKDVTVRRIFDTKEDIPESMRGSSYALTKHDGIVSLISYAVGCMFGRYSLDKPGLVYAGGNFDESYKLDPDVFVDEKGRPILFGGTSLAVGSSYKKVRIDNDWLLVSFAPDKDNILPVTDEEYFDDDIVGRFCAWLKAAYGPDTLEQNLDFIARALGGRGGASREVIRGYFLNGFFADHCKIYRKRPVYWLFDSGGQNGFKALVYMHRWNADTIGSLRVDYLHRMQRVYESEIGRMRDAIDQGGNSREAAAAAKREEKLRRQLKECREYDEKIGHLALSRIALDLDDGVKLNYRKAQTAADGKFYEILANSGDIMGKK